MDNEDTIEPKRTPAMNPQRTDAVKKLYDLWMADNQMLNTKLSQLFVVNSLLLAGLSLSLQKAPALIPVTCLFGFAFSMLYFFSLRRTIAFRTWYRKKLEDMSGDDTLPYLLPTPADEQGSFAPTDRFASHVPGHLLSAFSCIAWIVGFLVWLVR